MSIEEHLFKKVRINFDKLISYGFKKEKDRYLYSKDILNGSFRVDVEISDDAIIKGKNH